MKKQGMKKYFHINNYNILGGILLLPFALLFVYGMLGRIMQGDLTRYNRSFEEALSHSFIYSNYLGKPLILIAIAIVFPALAVLVNLIPLFNSIIKTKKLSPTRLFFTNPVAFFIALVGLFFLAIIFGHDIIPCIVKGLFKVSIGQFGHIVTVCSNA